jgi:NitT/TauT family transport system substrate-binding protein
MLGSQDIIDTTFLPRTFVFGKENQSVLRLIFIAILTVVFQRMPAASADAVRAGYSTKTVLSLHFFVAEKKGFFAAENLKVELIHMGSSTLNLQALISNEIHFSNIAPDGVIMFNEKGGNLKVVAGNVNAAPFTIVGAKPIKKVEDLRGGKIGVSSLTGGATTLLLEYLRGKRLFYPHDFALIVIGGGTPARLLALENGAVSATVLSIPISDMAIDKQFNRLGDVIEAVPRFQFSAINVNPAWAEKNRSTVVKFLKAHVRSLRWFHDHPDEAAALYTKEMTVRQPYARKAVDFLTKNNIFPGDGSVTMEGMKSSIEILAKAGVLSPPLPSPEKYLDLSYIKQAQKELGM